MVALRVRWAALGLPLLCASPVHLPRGAQEAAAPAVTRLALQDSPAIDLYFHVRALAAAGGEGAPSAFGAAIEAAQALDRELGSFALAWGPLEGLLGGCQTAADVQRAFARAPESFTLRSGASVDLRAGGARIAAALVEAEPAFLARKESAVTWDAHAASIAAARARWDEHVAPKEGELLRYHLESLGMQDPGLAIPVYLVADAPPPGAVTHLDDQGRGVCFVSVSEKSGTAGSQLFETVLHEATHALDVASQTSSVLGDLRRALEAAGVGPRDRAFRDLPHTLMFVQAAESVRRRVDPGHRDYGDVSGYYGRVPRSELVRGFWRDHLEGKLTRAEAVAGIVEGVKTR